MTRMVGGGQLARLLGQWHALPGRRSPEYAPWPARSAACSPTAGCRWAYGCPPNGSWPGRWG